jgi:2-oxoacid:acceptor oxidoreductase delta subunit (pyruvate/2-ketoisovalerate family)
MSDDSVSILAPHMRCPHRSATTGSWRVLRPEIDLEKCNLCLLCWVFCPEGVMRQEPEGLSVDLDYCKGCGICAYECRRGAIHMVETI